MGPMQRVALSEYIARLQEISQHITTYYANMPRTNTEPRYFELQDKRKDAVAHFRSAVTRLIEDGFTYEVTPASSTFPQALELISLYQRIHQLFQKEPARDEFQELVAPRATQRMRFEDHALDTLHAQIIALDSKDRQFGQVMDKLLEIMPIFSSSSQLTDLLTMQINRIASAAPADTSRIAWACNDILSKLDPKEPIIEERLQGIIASRSLALPPSPAPAPAAPVPPAVHEERRWFKGVFEFFQIKTEPPAGAASPRT